MDFLLLIYNRESYSENLKEVIKNIFTRFRFLLTKLCVSFVENIDLRQEKLIYDGDKKYVFLYKILTPLCALTSLKILTVSEASKQEIIQRLSIKNEKIKVIYNAVSPLFYDSNNSITKENSKKKYILAVSSIDPRKNFIRLLASLRYIKDKDVKLYVVGGQNSIYSTSINELSKNFPSERIKWLGRVSDEELKQYYTNALCFVYPSLYEGFGIPPLEAMACSTPTIVSDIAAIKEVCKDASLYVNPYDESDIADKINQLIEDDNLHK